VPVARDAYIGPEAEKKVIGSPQPGLTGTGAPPAVPQAADKSPVRTGSLERQPEIVSLIRQRLSAQPERSTREAKRLLNVWQLYQRVLDLVAPLSDDEAVVKRACHLVILAEIVTRWPAMQHRLHQRQEGQSGLQILAAACDDATRWEAALKVTGFDAAEHSRAAGNLRGLLGKYDGTAVADLAARVL
jgi:hypothetical protein